MTKQEAVIQLWEQASGHIGGPLLLAAISSQASELCGEKVTMDEAVEIIAAHERSTENPTTQPENG